MRTVFLFLLACTLALGVLLPSEQAHAQSKSGTISIYTYRTVTTRLTNENERLSSVAVAERKNAEAADRRWRSARRQLQQERASGKASAGRIAQLKKEAADRETEFNGAIERLNAQLAAKDDEFQRTLRAATAAGTDLLQSEEGQRALELIALGGEENTEAGIQILLAEQKIQDRVDKLRIADRASSIAITLLGLKGTAPSATTIEIIQQFQIVVANDPSRHKAWVDLSRLYLESGNFNDASHAAEQSLTSAQNPRDRTVSLNRLAEINLAKGSVAEANENLVKDLHNLEKIGSLNPESVIVQHDLAVRYTNIGDLEFTRNNHVSAISNYDKAIKILQKISALNPQDEKLISDISSIHSRISQAHLALMNARLALENALIGIDLLEVLNSRHPDLSKYGSRLSSQFNNLGQIYLFENSLSEAEAAFHRAIKLSADLHCLDPSSKWIQEHLARGHAGIGAAKFAGGNFSEAHEHVTESIQISKRNPLQTSTRLTFQMNTVESHFLLGDILEAQGARAKAREAYKLGLNILDDVSQSIEIGTVLRRDRFITYWKLAEMGDPAFPWSRVVEQLEAMDADGVLVPADQRFLGEARRRAQLEVESTP